MVVAHLAHTTFGVDDAVAARLTLGRKKLPKYARARGSLLVYWLAVDGSDVLLFEAHTTALDLQAIVSPTWYDAKATQILTVLC